MKDITGTVNGVCHALFLWDKLCHKVVHAHTRNHSDSNVNMRMCTTLLQSLSRCIGLKWLMSQMAGCHLGLGSNVQIGLFGF